ncbi:MAG: response regulator [Bdellovibrionales bacterium]
MPKKNLKVLVIDDDAESAQGVAECFQIYGFTSQISMSSEAIRQIQEATFDVILVDMKMKNASGLDLLRHFQKQIHSQNQTTKIFAMFEGQKAPGLDDLEIDGSVSKPVTAQKIIEIVRKASLSRVG